MLRVEDERKVGAMGTKYRKTHNGEPVEVNTYGCVLVKYEYVPYEDMLAEGYIEPIPTVPVELDRDVAERWAEYWRSFNGPKGAEAQAIFLAIEAALRD